MDLFLYQIEKENIEDKILVRGYFLDKNSEKHEKRFEIPFILNIEKNGFEELNIKKSEIFKEISGKRGPNFEEVVCIETFNKDFFNYLVNLTKEKRIKTFEIDLNPTYRLLIEEKVRIYSKEEKDAKKISKLFNILSLDIETIGDFNNCLIGMASITTNYEKFVFVNNLETNLEKLRKDDFKDLKILFCCDEKNLILEMKKKIIEINPHIIVGWNVINFDFDIIKKKCEIYNIEFNFSNISGEAKMRVSKSFFSRSSLSFPGIVVFDGIQMLRTNFIEFEEYNLNYVAKSVLKEEKINLEDEEEVGSKNKAEIIQKYFKENPNKLIKYNIQDSILVLKIFEKLSLIELIVSRSLITSTPIEKISSPIASLDIMYLKKLHKENKVASSNIVF